MNRASDALVRRNFILNVFEGGTYLSSNGFISVQTVLPALVARLGGTNVQVGAVSVISFVGAFLPQVFAARYAESAPWKKPMTVGFGLAQRLVMALLGVALLVLGRKAPQFALAAFFVFYSCNQVLGGIAYIAANLREPGVVAHMRQAQFADAPHQLAPRFEEVFLTAGGCFSAEICCFGFGLR